MTNVGSLGGSREAGKSEHLGWKELYLKEDWWAVWLGFALIVLAIVLFQTGSSNVLKALAINPGGLRWNSFSQLAAHFAQNASAPQLAMNLMWDRTARLTLDSGTRP